MGVFSWIHAHGPFPIAIGDTLGLLLVVVATCYWVEGSVRGTPAVTWIASFVLWCCMAILAHRAFHISTPITRWLYR